MGPMSRSMAWACFHSSGVSCGFSQACVILDKTQVEDQVEPWGLNSHLVFPL